jgi:hypothetical protein
LLSITPEQVLALAPDDTSKKAGQGLANGSKWQNTGTSERAVWGECQGSGSKPYQTVVESASLTVKCSCPSRKFPCKHGIGLLLLLSRNGSFDQSAEPAWAADWLEKRSEKAATATAPKAEKPVDTAARAKRSAAREEKVSAGLEELELWLKDIVRGGIVQLPEKPQRFYDDIARRLVDAQAPGIARVLRQTGELNFYAEGWQTPLLDRIARLYLAIEGFRRPESLEPALTQELRSFIGFPQSNEVLQSQPGVSATWLVAGSQYEQESGLATERHWLLGSEGHTALFLQFVPFNARPSNNLFPGQVFQGEIAYYPAAHPLRAGIRSQQAVQRAPAFPLLADWNAVAALETEKLSRSPFAGEQVYALQGLRPVQPGDSQWLIEDANGRQMLLGSGFNNLWKWLALSGGNLLPTIVLGEEHSFIPLGLWSGNTYIPFS